MGGKRLRGWLKGKGGNVARRKGVRRLCSCLNGREEAARLPAGGGRQRSWLNGSEEAV